MMGRMSQSLAGRWSTFLDTIGRVARGMGSILLPVLKDGVNYAIDFANSFRTSGQADKLATSIAYALQAVGRAIPPIISGVSQAWPVIAQFGRMTLAFGRGRL